MLSACHPPSPRAHNTGGNTASPSIGAMFLFAAWSRRIAAAKKKRRRGTYRSASDQTQIDTNTNTPQGRINKKNELLSVVGAHLQLVRLARLCKHPALLPSKDAELGAGNIAG